MTPEHIHWRDLRGMPGSLVIYCGWPTGPHTGKAWRVTCPRCLMKLDEEFNASTVYVR